MQISTAGLRLGHNRQACGRILEVNRDATAAGEEQLVSFAAEQSEYFFICIAFGPYGDLPFKSWGRWQCLRGGADAGLLCQLRLRHRMSVRGTAGGGRVETCLS
jgi:hypothetical protein